MQVQFAGSIAGQVEADTQHVDTEDILHRVALVPELLCSVDIFTRILDVVWHGVPGALDVQHLVGPDLFFGIKGDYDDSTRVFDRFNVRFVEGSEARFVHFQVIVRDELEVFVQFPNGVHTDGPHLDQLVPEKRNPAQRHRMEGPRETDREDLALAEHVKEIQRPGAMV